MNKPTISLDVKNFLKNKIDKKIEDNKDKIEEKLNKVLKDKDSEKTKELIKNIKSLFQFNMIIIIGFKRLCKDY